MDEPGENEWRPIADEFDQLAAEFRDVLRAGLAAVAELDQILANARDLAERAEAMSDAIHGKLQPTKKIMEETNMGKTYITTTKIASLADTGASAVRTAAQAISAAPELTVDGVEFWTQQQANQIQDKLAASPAA